MLTVLVAANSDGTEILPLLVIGKSKKPRAFNSVKALPCRYKNNKSAWMTCEIFEDYLKYLDRQMVLKRRKIIILIDNCSSKPKNYSFLKNILIEFFPPRTI